MNPHLKHSLIWLAAGLILLLFLLSANSCATKRYSYVTTVNGVRTNYADLQTINEAYNNIDEHVDGFYDIATKTIWCQEWDWTAWWHEYRHHKGECHTGTYPEYEWFPCLSNKLFHPPTFEERISK